MPRLVVTLILLSLLAPGAFAAPDAGLAEPARPSLPDLAPAGRALREGAASAAGTAGDALAAAGAGIANAAAFLAQAAGAAVAALGEALAALAAFALSLVASLGSLLGALFSALAALGLAGARAVAAHPKESAIVAGSASGLGLFAWAAKKWWLSLFVPLYSRLARSEMLDNKVRSSVYEYVKANPGAHPSRIADALGIGWGTIVYHLARLEEASLVSTRESRNRKCYFAVGSDLDNAGRSAVAAMSTDKARLIVDALRAEPGLSQKGLADKLGMSQALASWHVKRLIASGILVATRDGRSNLLHVAEHVPVLAAPALPLAA